MLISKVILKYIYFFSLLHCQIAYKTLNEWVVYGPSPQSSINMSAKVGETGAWGEAYYHLHKVLYYIYKAN